MATLSFAIRPSLSIAVTLRIGPPLLTIVINIKLTFLFISASNPAVTNHLHRHHHRLRIWSILQYVLAGGTEKLMTSKYSGSRSSLPKIANFGPPRAEKLFFSDKILACSNDCAPKHMYDWLDTWTYVQLSFDSHNTSVDIHNNKLCSDAFLPPWCCS